NLYRALRNNPVNTIDPSGTQAEDASKRYQQAHQALTKGYQANLHNSDPEAFGRLQAEYEAARTEAQAAIDIPLVKEFGKFVLEQAALELTGLALVRVAGWLGRAALQTRAGARLLRPAIEIGSKLVNYGRSSLDWLSPVGRQLSQLEGESLESLVAESVKRVSSRGFSGTPAAAIPSKEPTIVELNE